MPDISTVDFHFFQLQNNCKMYVAVEVALSKILVSHKTTIIYLRGFQSIPVPQYIPCMLRSWNFLLPRIQAREFMHTFRKLLQSTLFLSFEKQTICFIYTHKPVDAAVLG